MWMRLGHLCAVLCAVVPYVANAQGGALSYSVPSPPPPPASSGGALILTPDSPSAPQPSSQNSSMLSPAPAPGPLGGNDMPQSSGLSIGAIAGIAVGGAVAAVMALGVLLRLCCCRSCGHHGARSARQESAPCTSLSEHSSPWEKVQVGNDKFISTLDVHTIPEEVFVKEASPEYEEQGGRAVPGILTQKVDNTWKLARGTVMICLDSSGAPEKLGGRGDATFYKGRLRGHHSVAVKILEKGSEKQQERIIRDIRIMKACLDPNIVRFLGAEVRTKHILLATELLSCDLNTKLRSDTTGLYRWKKRGRQIVLNILHGLEYLHGLEIAHLGLRSHDILLDKEGQAKIGSVGLGRLVGTYGTLATAAGSPLWAAPEQINGEVCSTKADIWAFGTILWEICSGDQLVRRSELTLAVPKQAPQEVADILGRCHSIRPEDRPTAAAIMAKLTEIETDAL